MSQYENAVSIVETSMGSAGGVPIPVVIIDRYPRPYKEGDEDEPGVKIVMPGETVRFHDSGFLIFIPRVANRRQITNLGNGTYLEKRLRFFGKSTVRSRILK